MEKTIIWSAFWGYLKYVWREKKILFFFGLLFFPAFIVANYLQVYLPKMIVMELEEKRSITYLGLSTFALILVLMGSILVREKMLSKIQFGNRYLSQKMQNDYAGKLLYVDYSCLEDKEFLSMKNLTKESLFGGSIGEGQERARLKDFMETLLMIIAAGGNALVYLYYLGKLSPWLILLLFVVIAGGTLLNMKIFRKNEGKYGQKAADSWQKLDYVTRKTEDFSMAKDIRLYHMDDWLSGLVGDYLRERMYYKKKEMASRGLGDVIYILSIGIYIAAVFAMLLVRFWDGRVEVSDVVFYANMGPALYHLLADEVSTRSIHLFKIITEFQRFQCFMDYGEDTGRLEAALQKDAPVITLEKVSFSYPGTEREVLKDIDLQVQAGENVAIVGVNGAGKTTLMKLICGLLQPTSGRILLNGVDMKTMEAEERYAHFSCTFQDIQFLPVSIRENISQEIDGEASPENTTQSVSGEASPENTTQSVSGEISLKNDSRDDENDARIWYCLEQAGIQREIKELPLKLDTLLEKSINEDATDFSGGQRQKLILARALYRDAGALILDEPTAALDALAENDIYERYAEFAAGKTSFFVSHRLSSTRFCNRILLLDGGNIAEEGTHDELLAKKGIYANMFEMQSKYYQGGEAE